MSPPPEDPFAAIDASIGVAHLIAAFRGQLKAQGVAPDFQDQMCRDFANHVYNMATVAQISGLLKKHPGLAVGPAGDVVLAHLAEVIRKQAAGD